VNSNGGRQSAFQHPIRFWLILRLPAYRHQGRVGGMAKTSSIAGPLPRRYIARQSGDGTNVGGKHTLRRERKSA